jgi:hypothetical protein
MPAQIEINQKAIRRFHEAIVSLARMSGGDFKTVIKSELGIVFSQTVKNMKKAQRCCDTAKPKKPTWRRLWH